MPNRCWTNVCFRGKKENVEKLKEVFVKADEFSTKHRGYCNVKYLMSLCDFDTDSYKERYTRYDTFNGIISKKYKFYDCNFRGNSSDGGAMCQSLEDGYTYYYPTFEFAWDTDYIAIQLLCMMFDLQFCAYSSEEGMDFRTRCKNSDYDEYNYDYSIYANPEQYEEAYEKDNTLDNYIFYDNPVVAGSEEEKYIINTLDSLGIDYEEKDIEIVPTPVPYGVYYHYPCGVAYDDGHRYPEADEFNRYLIKGVSYDSIE